MLFIMKFFIGIGINKLGLLKKDWGEIGEKKLENGEKWGFLRVFRANLAHF